MTPRVQVPVPQGRSQLFFTEKETKSKPKLHKNLTYLSVAKESSNDEILRVEYLVGLPL